MKDFVSSVSNRAEWVAPRSISVVVNTCNRATSLDATLASLLQQSFRDMEIVVVNGPSTDRTPEIIDKYRGRVKVVQCAELNLSVSRNIGIKAAAGDVIAFIDDDALPEPFWAERILAAYNDEDIGAVGGFVFDHTGTDYQATYIVCDRYGKSWTRIDANPSGLYSFPGAFRYSALIGTNCSFRRDLLVKLGGFDEEYEYFLDETDVCVRLIDRGYKILQISDAFVHHKFLPSHMRTAAKATVHHYPILKNTIYFGLRHASVFVGREAVYQCAEEIFAVHLRDAELAARDGRISHEVYDRLPAAYQRARQDALDHFERGPRTRPASTFVSPRLPFLSASPGESDSKGQLCIALICRYYDVVDSGIARFIRVQARALAALGHIVHVVAEAQAHPSVDWEEGVWIHRVLLGWYDDQAAYLPIRIHLDQWCFARSALDEIRRINKRHQIDVIEAPLWGNEAIAAIASQEIPVVVSLQTSQAIALDSHPEWQADVKFMSEVVRPTIEGENYVLANCHRIRAISKAIVNEIEKRNEIVMNHQRIVICPLALEDRATSARISQCKYPQILFVGRLELRKGIDILLAAIPRVLALFPEARFIVVGDDSLPNGASDETFRLTFEKSFPHLSESVSFKGKLPDSEVDKYFCQATLFVAPSRFESFGLVYVEAMMFSLPSIGCKVGGIPEVFGDSNCGVLVSPDAPEELATAIIDALRDKQMLEARAELARQTYVQRFTPDRMAAELVLMYRALLVTEREKRG
ncbi:glycosyltransferase [Burkholderia cepacia]|uniref:glycosyltransferase n=1 Tax=Burkholderia cepacia TaxID=292 RepID=UPI001CF2695D|nr:glycosyltransferase [Burkholderia cepacia]MCA7893338.1 glycosyltransferase [Burkholderia cepacia]